MAAKKKNTGATFEAMADLFKHLSDPCRLRLLMRLAHKESSVGDLAEHLDASLSAVSHQLRQLRTAQIVSRRREGKSIFYRLIDDHVQQLIVISQEHVSHP